ncbi:hypothetical protein BDY19DRAFT_143670 [Irpex rosettiformis]|uniref:Uncharacterized protein n=1 Tax=Irpex rosettiformis TaxID=378272 RepID=A0ACB8U394_9APHY|nr:hypothetical protein BDY19DRAFT_143670 [Irpex rosettiformis]
MEASRGTAKPLLDGQCSCFHGSVISISMSFSSTLTFEQQYHFPESDADTCSVENSGSIEHCGSWGGKVKEGGSLFSGVGGSICITGGGTTIVKAVQDSFVPSHTSLYVGSLVERLPDGVTGKHHHHRRRSVPPRDTRAVLMKPREGHTARRTTASTTFCVDAVLVVG